jgi:hypothetical protein
MSRFYARIVRRHKCAGTEFGTGTDIGNGANTDAGTEQPSLLRPLLIAFRRPVVVIHDAKA